MKNKFELVRTQHCLHTIKNTKKCQPAARDTPDLIQTVCVPDRGLARLKKLTERKITKMKIKIKLVCTQGGLHKIKNTKKCQPAARDTPDLIQTVCVPDRGLARLKKLTERKTSKMKNKFELVCTHRGPHIIKNTKKCQPAARDTPDLIQTVCVPDRGLARSKKLTERKNSKKKKSKVFQFLRKNITVSTVLKNGLSKLQNVKKSQLISKMESPSVKMKGLSQHFTDSNLVDSSRTCLTEKMERLSPHLSDRKFFNSANSCLNTFSPGAQYTAGPVSSISNNNNTSTIQWYCSNKIRNKLVKSSNGNIDRKAANLKIMSWNLGPRLWINKVQDICHLLEDFSPDVAIISEANLYIYDEPHLTFIDNYDINTTNDYTAHGLSRLVVLTKKDLKFQILRNSMEDDIATIWLKFPRRGKKPFFLGAVYREHKLLNRPGQGPNLSGNFQLERLRKIVTQWENIQKEGGFTLVTGDMNIDYIQWDNLEYEHHDMVEAIRDNIETLGFAQLVKGPTRFWVNSRPSLIDHAWTNDTEAVTSCRNIFRPVADHNAVETIIKLKGKNKSKTEILKRKWTKLDIETFKLELNLVNWDQIYEIENVDLAYNFMEENLRRILDNQIPVTKIQPNGAGKTWIKDATKELIKQRDNLKLLAHNTNNQQDWYNYRLIEK